ncbi:MAG: glycosyltransferase [Candidatus Micrarchaeota archaeon]|nr:glycosyltransferase [Candidatus Micrarchaeota archaeon]
MRVALLGLEGNFSRNVMGGIPAYMYETYTNLRGMQSGRFRVEKIEYRRRRELKEALGWFYIVIRGATEDYSKFDIVHNLDVKPIYPMNRGKAVFMVTAHDFQPLTAPHLDTDMKSSLKSRIKLHLEIRQSLKIALKSDYMIAVSTTTRDDAVSLGYDPKRISVVPHGVSRRLVTTPIPKSSGRDFVVGYIGAFRRRKNLRMAIDAFMGMDSRPARMELWGNRAYDYERLSAHAARDHRIRFMGFAPDDRYVQTYDRFDAFVFPSLYEGFGISILEAQARGLPVIIFKDAKIPREVRRYCIEARDAGHMTEILQTLMENGYSSRDRGVAMRYARGFTWEKSARQTLKAYQRSMVV